MPKVGSIAYQEQGSGPALLLLHGFPVDGRMWNHQLQGLSDRHRVIALDHRGFGQSRPPSAMSIESMADDVHGVVDALKLERFVLAGLSMGGYVALAYEKKYPATLRGLMLIDTRAEGDDTAGRENRVKMATLARQSGAKAIADAMIDKLLSPGTLKSRPHVVQSVRDMAESQDPEALAFALLAMRDRTDQTSSLPSIATPTLILVGDADSITPPSVAQAMQSQIPRSKRVVIQGAGHMSPMEQPEQVNRAVVEFVGTLAR